MKEQWQTAIRNEERPTLLQLVKVSALLMKSVAQRFKRRHSEESQAGKFCRQLCAAMILTFPLAGGIAHAAGQWETLTLPHGPDQVRNPRALAVDARGNLYVADSVLNRIQMRTPQGDWSVIAPDGSQPGEVSYVPSLAVDAEGNLFAADTGNHRIQMRTSQGVWSVIASKGNQPGQVLTSDQQLAVDAQGNLYVRDLTRIMKRTPQGTWSMVASPGNQLGQVSHFKGMAVDVSGNLFISDYTSFYIREDYKDVTRVQMRSPQGVWSEITPAQGVFYQNLAVDTAGNLFAGYQGGISMRSPQGVWSVIAGNGDRPGQFMSHGKLVTDPAGNLFAIDRSTHRVQMRTPEGIWSVIASRGSQPGEVTEPSTLEADALGNLYVVDYDFRRLQMRTPQGAWSVLTSPSDQPGQLSIPGNLAIDSKDNLFVSNDNGGQIQMRTPQGVWSVITPSGDQPGEWYTTASLAIDRQDNLFVWSRGTVTIDGKEIRLPIRMRTPQGVWSSIAPPDDGTGKTFEPHAWALDGRGNLYVSYSREGDPDPNRYQVIMRTPEGVWSVIAPEGRGLGQVLQPDYLAADGNGNLFVGEPYSYSENGEFQCCVIRLQMRTPEGVWSNIAQYPRNVDKPRPDEVLTVSGIYVDPKNHLYVYDRNRFTGPPRLLRRTPEGVWSVIVSGVDWQGYQQGEVSINIYSLEQVAGDAMGNLFISEHGRSRSYYQKLWIDVERASGVPYPWRPIQDPRSGRKETPLARTAYRRGGIGASPRGGEGLAGRAGSVGGAADDCAGVAGRSRRLCRAARRSEG